MLHKFVKNKTFITRGSHSYGIPVENITSIFIRGLRSQSVENLWKLFEKSLKDNIGNILSIRRINNFNDSFILVKLLGTSDFAKEISNIITSKISRASVSYTRCTRRTHRLTFTSFKRKLTSPFNHHNPNFSSNNVNSDSPNTNVIPSTSNIISTSHSQTSSIHSSAVCTSNSNSSNNPPSNSSNSFTFCLSWNTNG